MQLREAEAEANSKRPAHLRPILAPKSLLLFKEILASLLEQLWVGVPSEPSEFIKRVVKAGHPRSIKTHQSELVKAVLVENFRGDPLEFARTRIKQIARGLTGPCNFVRLRPRPTARDLLLPDSCSKTFVVFQRDPCLF